jgi:N-acyl-D-amino-acid deacylase
MKRHDPARRSFLASGLKAAAVAATFGPGRRAFAAPTFDVVVRGGTVLDGTGGPGLLADIGIRGETIAAVGTIAPEQGARIVDATGLHVAPGFVDIHTHSDGDILAYTRAESRVLQGVTTELTGNCGSSAAPLGGRDVEEQRRRLREELGFDAGWTDLASYGASVDRARVSVNQALLVGQGTLRRSVAGMENRPLRPEERAAVLAALEEALDQGAFGLSTGLEYTPGRFTPTDEIVDMARLVGRRGGLYASHVRSEDVKLLEAVDEAVTIGRLAGVRVEVSHLKVCGQRNWTRQRGALDLLEGARRQGVDVRADAYPYGAYSTGLTIFIDDWALDGGTPALMRRLKDAAQRARMREAIPARIEAEPGDPSLITISDVRTGRNRSVVGRTLAAIAADWKMDVADALLRLLEEEEGGVSYVGHAMSPANVEMVLAHPLVMIGSDGSSMAPVGRAAASRPHPRSYGTYARVLDHYVRERALFDLPTAIRKMTALPAEHIGLRDRGRIGRGLKADLVAFDAARVRDRATFEDPHRHPEGIRHVLVNGVLTVESGAHTGAAAGRFLRPA